MDIKTQYDSIYRQVQNPLANKIDRVESGNISLCLVLKNGECYVYEAGDILVGRYTKTTAFYIHQINPDKLRETRHFLDVTKRLTYELIKLEWQ